MFVGGTSGGCKTEAQWERERERERERESYLAEQQGLGVAMSNIGVMVGKVLTVWTGSYNQSQINTEVLEEREWVVVK